MLKRKCERKDRSSRMKMMREQTTSLQRTPDYTSSQGLKSGGGKGPVTRTKQKVNTTNF